MRPPTRRTLLRGAGASLLVLPLAGCVDPLDTLDGPHHRPELFVDNEADVELTVAVTVVTPDGDTRFDRRVSVAPEGSETFPEALAREDESTTTCEVTATFEDGQTASRTVDAGSGLHRLWVVLSPDAVELRREVH